MDYARLRDAVERGTALRTRNRLQPTGGPGDVVYPPTYADGSTRHVRRVNGEDVTCVLLDSVQSQANRMEIALRRSDLDIPCIVVEVGDYQLSCLELPHRICDAVLRGCLMDGKPYLKSRVGKAILDHDLTELFGVSPASLLFGLWHSNRAGGVGLKVPRSVTAEIVAVNARDAPHTESRIDPLPFSKDSKVLRIDDADKVASDGWDWRRDKNGKRPSEVLLGNIAPSIKEDRGITMDHAQHIGAISMAGLRHLRLGPNGITAATCLAAIGLAGFTLAFGNGCWLRSRCDLVPENPYEWELLCGPCVETIGEITPEIAGKLLSDAVAAVRAAKLPWYGETRLEPSEHLETLVAEGLQRIGVD